MPVSSVLWGAASSSPTVAQLANSTSVAALFVQPFLSRRHRHRSGRLSSPDRTESLAERAAWATMDKPTLGTGDRGFDPER